MTEAATAQGFRPPAYPYDRLEPLRAAAAALDGGGVDLSVGTPTDPPPEAVLRALSRTEDTDGGVRGYPASIGSAALLDAVAAWLDRRFGVSVTRQNVAVCVGTKEFVASLPHLLALRRPGPDTVLYPAISYPTYAMGAQLAGLRPVPVPVDDNFRLRLDAVAEEDANRALLLWVNSPGNPAGQLDDLEAAAVWGRRRGVLVASDECYADYTWVGPPRTILTAARCGRRAAEGTAGDRTVADGTVADGTAGDRAAGDGMASGTTADEAFAGVLALHSLSKRSNTAGLRLGWYTGDPEVVAYLREVRKHAGLMVPGPTQRAGIVALADEEHVEHQRQRYRQRLERMAAILTSLGLSVREPEGGFYLWVPAPAGDAWGLADRLARQGGALVSPGEFYGPDGADHVRIALVRPLERLDLVARRLGV